VAAAILWRRLDRPGHEASRLVDRGGGARLEGSAVFLERSAVCRLAYAIDLDAAFRTRAARVEGFVGERAVEIEVAANDGAWTLQGEPMPGVAGALDLDLNFSPSTNLLPIRRLRLPIGDAAEVRAAWLRFPSFALEPLEQTYRRLAERVYRYESAGGRFRRDLEVDAAGFPLRYPDFWEAESRG
jgi:hypothetical protein